MRTCPLVAFAAVLAAPLSAQIALRMDPAVVPGQSGIHATYDVAGVPGYLYALFADIDGGPADVLGERLYLRLSPNLATLTAGIVPASGTAPGSFGIPLSPGLVGLVVYGQCVVLDASAPNGLFRVSNGASTAIHGGTGAIVAAFDAPIAAGYTGSFAADLPGHVRGGPVTRRTHETADLSAPAYSAGVIGAKSPFGGRSQTVYSANDLGATGEPELITAIRWGIPSNALAYSDTFQQFELRCGHTTVTPDFTIDPFSALPLYPNSGLSTTFAANELPGAPPVTVYQGPYTIDPTQVVANPMLPFLRYLPYPMFAPFAYDGVSSLLLELRVPPSSALGLNGESVRLRVQSSPNPFARAVVAGTAGSPLNPATATTASIADCAMNDLQLEFTRVDTFALSPWLDSGAVAPDYGAPVVARSLPAGTGIDIEYRGAAAATGANPTAWSASPDVADGMRFLQFRIVFHANHLTDERPVVDTLAVPFQ